MTTNRKSGRANNTGRNKHSDQYMTISYKMVHSEAWRSLSGPAVRFFLELRTRYHGSNNGKIFLSMDEGARLLSISKSTVKTARDELVDKGFITITKPGYWFGRQATLYSVTDKGLDGDQPTNAWKHWRRPPKSNPRYSHRTYSPSDGSVRVPRA